MGPRTIENSASVSRRLMASLTESPTRPNIIERAAGASMTSWPFTLMIWSPIWIPARLAGELGATTETVTGLTTADTLHSNRACLLDWQVPDGLDIRNTPMLGALGERRADISPPAGGTALDVALRADEKLRRRHASCNERGERHGDGEGISHNLPIFYRTMEARYATGVTAERVAVSALAPIGWIVG